ncbi:hypothetical protein P153DRAFT_368939 [Dothidotthia symphoricarpi CBS 119687]|uniref:Uncharacterized protein n=1 Tax=Dothidotthia symphoricarpi CBS 119687 TaxID=1392245 RepID=A0A6A6A5U4_9PLEO|nr:uncharacterized protein P153DRAFT_368939 [Dothidotthia symphoricarpi CBS 119687]KAF2126916.1 hypothetical protein P153DRAFT_368939 [Dothidotthia symphoricarpi CBS 119687]
MRCTSSRDLLFYAGFHVVFSKLVFFQGFGASLVPFTNQIVLPAHQTALALPASLTGRAM